MMSGELSLTNSQVIDYQIIANLSFLKYLLNVKIVKKINYSHDVKKVENLFSLK